jgi:hypothetical protein
MMEEEVNNSNGKDSNNRNDNNNDVNAMLRVAVAGFSTLDEVKRLVEVEGADINALDEEVLCTLSL